MREASGQPLLYRVGLGVATCGRDEKGEHERPKGRNAERDTGRTWRWQVSAEQAQIIELDGLSRGLYHVMVDTRG